MYTIVNQIQISPLEHNENNVLSKEPFHLNVNGFSKKMRKRRILPYD